MHALIDMGVDGIMTDRPSALTTVLAETQTGWQW
jgi:glycerophosphoryl diester phosphodiesterase